MKTKSILKFALNLVTAFLFSAILGFAIEEATGVAPLNFAVIAVGLTISVQIIADFAGYKRIQGVASMSLLTEVWSTTIQENLYQNNDFINRSTDHSMWISYKTVHIPQAGAVPTVEKNRAILPATIGSRTDSELTYDLNQFTADPIVIQKVEELQISYAKRMSVLTNYINQLGFVVSTHTLYAWAVSGAGSQVQTTGSAVSTTLPHSTATGTRKAITLADILKAKAILDKQNVPSMGRVLLMTADEYNYNFLAINNVQAYYASQNNSLSTGVVGQIFGFDVMIRPDVLVYDNSATGVIKAINGDGTLASPATTDCGACIAYHPAFVSKALGSVIPYFEPNKAAYYGDLFSAEVMHGASLMRTDQKGVVAIIQAWVS